MDRVPKVIWFDNLSSAVISILKNGERVLTDRFQRFALHYGFKASFCNPNSGHEKGNIETKSATTGGTSSFPFQVSTRLKISTENS